MKRRLKERGLKRRGLATVAAEVVVVEGNG